VGAARPDLANDVAALALRYAQLRFGRRAAGTHEGAGLKREIAALERAIRRLAV
jgi:hypothetical protein